MTRPKTLAEFEQGNICFYTNKANAWFRHDDQEAQVFFPELGVVLAKLMPGRPDELAEVINEFSSAVRALASTKQGHDAAVPVSFPWARFVKLLIAYYALKQWTDKEHEVEQVAGGHDTGA